MSLQREIVVLRQQLAVYRRSAQRPRIQAGDRILWSWRSCHGSRWREVLVFVQPSTVIAWQRQRFRARLSRHRGAGRPTVAEEVRALIRQISGANPGWGSPRIAGELRKLTIEAAKSTVDKYCPRFRKPPSETWRAFLNNHVKDLVAIDFFTVPTARFKVLFVLVVLSHRAAGWSISTSPSTLVRCGRRNKWLRRSLGIARPRIYFETAIASITLISSGGSKI